MGTETLASKFPGTLGRLTLEDMASVRLDGSGFQDAAQRLPRRRSEVWLVCAVSKSQVYTALHYLFVGMIGFLQPLKGQCTLLLGLQKLEMGQVLVAQAFNPSYRRQRQVDLSEFEASLGYKLSYSTDRGVSRKKQNKTKPKQNTKDMVNKTK